MEELKLPNHIGIIMDGNGRWATKRGLPRSAGHKAGAENLKKLCRHINKLGLNYLSLYAFSTENFKREVSEVNYLMNLFIEMFTNDFKFLIEDNVKVLFSGRREGLPKNVVSAIEKMESDSKDNTGTVLNICLNYGSQDEIVDMVKKISNEVKESKISIEDINKELVNRNMYYELPPVDFVIRTSGEMRISNFMLWQSSYAEYYFPETLFPDFNENEFDKAIEEFNKRHRRFGGN